MHDDGNDGRKACVGCMRWRLRKGATTYLSRSKPTLARTVVLYLSVGRTPHPSRALTLRTGLGRRGNPERHLQDFQLPSIHLACVLIPLDPPRWSQIPPNRHHSRPKLSDAIAPDNFSEVPTHPSVASPTQPTATHLVSVKRRDHLNYTNQLYGRPPFRVPVICEPTPVDVFSPPERQN